MNNPNAFKILFELEQIDGYPPVTVESVWGKKVDVNNYEVDNIPFFVKLLALGDIVEAIENEFGELIYQKHVKYSKHSTIRVLFKNVDDVDTTRNKLKDLGCSSELSHLPKLIAVDIPQDVQLSKVIEFLQEGENKSNWEFEEACIWD